MMTALRVIEFDEGMDSYRYIGPLEPAKVAAQMECDVAVWFDLIRQTHVVGERPFVDEHDGLIFADTWGCHPDVDEAWRLFLGNWWGPLDDEPGGDNPTHERIAEFINTWGSPLNLNDPASVEQWLDTDHFREG